MDFVKSNHAWVSPLIGQGDLKPTTSWSSVAKAVGLIGAGCAASMGLYAYYQRQLKKEEESKRVAAVNNDAKIGIAVKNTNDRLPWLQIDADIHEENPLKRVGHMVSSVCGRNTILKVNDPRRKNSYSESDGRGQNLTPRKTSCEVLEKSALSPLSWSGGSTRTYDKADYSPGLIDCCQDMSSASSRGSSQAQGSPKEIYSNAVQTQPYIQGTSLKDVYDAYTYEGEEDVMQPSGEKNINCNNPNNQRGANDSGRLKLEHSEIYPPAYTAEKMSVMRACASDANYRRVNNQVVKPSDSEESSNPYPECIETCSRDLLGTPVDEAHLLAKYLALNSCEDGSPVDLKYLASSPKRKHTESEMEARSVSNSPQRSPTRVLQRSFRTSTPGGDPGTVRSPVRSSSFASQKTPLGAERPANLQLTQPTIDKYITNVLMPAHKILLLGLPGSGKSTLLSAWAGMTGEEIVEESGTSMAYIPIAKQRLQIIEVDGSKNGRKRWPNYYEGAEAVIFLMDSTAMLSIRETEIKTLQGLLTEPKLLGVPLMLLIHKQDSPLAHNCMEISNPLKLNRISPRKRVVKVLPTEVPPAVQDVLSERKSQEILNFAAAKNIDKAARLLAGMVSDIKSEA